MLMRHHVDSRTSNLSLLMVDTNISLCIWDEGERDIGPWNTCVSDVGSGYCVILNVMMVFGCL